MNSILQVFYSIFSGLLLSVAIPNELLQYGSAFIAFFSVGLFYYAIKQCKSYKVAFLCGFSQTLTTHLLSSFWLANFRDFAIFTLGASALATGIIGGFFGLFLFLPYVNYPNIKINTFKFHKNFSETPCFRIVFFTSIYTVYEWAKSSGFLGYPWGTISSAMYNFPEIMQISDITGTYGITFLVVLFNCIFIELIEHFLTSKLILNISKRTSYFLELRDISIVFIILFALSFFYGNYQYNLTRKPTKLLSTIMIQQNADPWVIYTDEQRILDSEELTRSKIYEYESLNKKPDLIVWSEGTLLYPFPSSKRRYEIYPSECPVIPFIQEIGIPMITGGAFVKPYFFNDEQYNKFYNAALAFDGDGNLRGHYAKLHLVPFAEALPGNDIPFIRELMMKYIGISQGWAKGEQLTYFDVPCSWYDLPINKTTDIININLPYNVYKEYIENIPTVKIATPICFDDAFTDVMRPLFNNGAELFINITDDSWSLKKSSEYQHFVIASYRAIEYRTTMVRVTNAGCTVVVDPSGKIICDLPLFEKAAAGFDVPIYVHRSTIYAIFGNWLPYTLIILFFAFCFYSKKNFKKTDFIASERKNKKKNKK